MRILAVITGLFLFISGYTLSFAGSGLYLGADAVRHTLATATTTTYSDSVSPDYGEARESFNDWGLRLGYKYKSRLTHRYFWAPELVLMSFDANEVLYGTNLRLGYEFAPLEVYAGFGVSRVDKFTDNRLNYGLGLEYRLTNQASLNLEWTGYDTITESTQSTITIGAINVDVDTYTERKTSTLKLGFTYYFQGSI